MGYAWNQYASTPDYVYDKDTNTFTPAYITLNSDNPNRTLYAIWYVPPITDISQAIYMQEMNADVCASMNTSSGSSSGSIFRLKDKRNNISYNIQWLRDGKCWMRDTLSLVLSDNVALTNADTDLNTVESWTPMRSNLSAQRDFIFDNLTPYVYSGYYNWSAAVASNDTSSLVSGEAPNSICPKGWKLPSAADFNALKSAEIYFGAFNARGYLYSDGKIYGTGASSAASTGYYWTSTIISSTQVYYRTRGSNGSLSSSNSSQERNRGFSIVCVSR